MWLEHCRSAFAAMTADKQGRESQEAKARSVVPAAQADDLIDFYHLKSRKGLSQVRRRPLLPSRPQLPSSPRRAQPRPERRRTACGAG